MLLARPRRSLRTARRYNKRRVEAWKIIATPSSSVTSMAWSSHGASWSGLLALAELDHLGQIRDGQSSARRARRGVSRPDGAESLRGGGSPATRSCTSLEMTSPSVAPRAELCTPSPRRPPRIFSPRGIVPRYRRVFFLAHLLAAALPEAVLSGGAAACRFAPTGCGASWASGRAQLAQFVRIILQCYRALLPTIMGSRRGVLASVPVRH